MEWIMDFFWAFMFFLWYEALGLPLRVALARWPMRADVRRVLSRVMGPALLLLPLWLLSYRYKETIYQVVVNAQTGEVSHAVRAALSEVTAALTDGEPYAEPLGTMQENGVTVPDALAAPASEGVPTLSALVEEYPPLARDALSAARMAESETEGGTERFATFLSNQLGVRSVTPREGDTADAVLSRAEAALRSGDLPAALSGLGTLPDEARAPLADWISRAQTRADAVAAADAVSLELNKE